MKQILSITLTAVESKRNFSLDQLGVPALLVFLWLDTQHLAEPINKAVRKRYPLARQALVINIASLRGVPGVLHGMAEKEMQKAYREYAARLPRGYDPKEYMIILPDWKGDCAYALGIRDLASKPAVAALDRSGRIVGVHQGEPDTLEQAALALLEKAEQADIESPIDE